MSQVVTNIRLPGVYFLPPPRSGQPSLPPLDVTGFVGFAQRGPLDTPVRIDDFQTYTAIFGGDLAVAMDAGGRIVWANLPRAVLDFFANGGRRCYVVRVTGADAAPARISLDGLVSIAQTGPGNWSAWPTSLLGSSPGTWASNLSLGTRLNVGPARVSQPSSVPAISIPDGPDGPVMRVQWSVRSSSNPVQVGDLLRLWFASETFGSDGPWLTKVEAVTSSASTSSFAASSAASNLTLDLSAARRVLTLADHFVFPAAQTAMVTPLQLNQTSGPTETGWFNASSAAFTLDLAPTTQSQSLAAGTVLKVDLANGSYLFQVAARQFANPDPASGLATGAIAEIVRLTANQLMPLAPQSLPTTVPTRVEILRLDLLFRYVTAGQPIAQQQVSNLGFNAGQSRFFGVTTAGESSPLVSTATAGESSSPLNRGTYGPGYVAPAPDFSDNINSGDGGGPAVAGNDSIRDPAAVAQLAGFVGQLTAADLPPQIPIANVTFLPLGMDDVFTPLDFNGPDTDSPGNDDLQTFDPTRFYDQTLLSASGSASTLLTAAFQLKFAQATPVALRGLHSLCFEDEVALVALPDATQRNWEPDTTSVPITPASAPQAITARCEEFTDCHAVHSPSTVTTIPPIPQATARLPLSESPTLYDAQGLLTTHQIILMFCQSRADVMGILALPSHFRTADCVDWQARFRGISSLPPRPTLSDNLRTFADQSYVAVYHPWMQVSDPSEPDGLREVPPDGAACGLIASRELSRGVWVAAGNMPLVNVLGLTPSLPPVDLPDLFDRRFNLLRQQYGDFRVICAHTLGDGSDYLQVSVRRLMMLLRKVAQIRGMTYVFRNNDRLLAESVRSGMLAMLNQMFELGAFAGDIPQHSFRVFTGSNVNTPQSIALGQFIVVIQVAPSQPLEFMTVVLVRQSDGGLQVREG